MIELHGKYAFAAILVYGFIALICKLLFELFKLLFEYIGLTRILVVIMVFAIVNRRSKK